MSSGHERSDDVETTTRRSSPSLTILADDLTGAADAAVAFTSISNTVRVDLGSAPTPRGDVWAISTQTREISSDLAEEKLRHIAHTLPTDRELFKKVDSVFRGNTIVELRSLLQHLPFDLAVIAPAYPALGRTMLGGVLHVLDISGEQQVPVLKRLANHCCSLRPLPTSLSADDMEQEMRACLSHPSRAVLCDAAEQSDLHRIVRSARSLSARVLWVGSAGLAHALAAEFAPLPSPPLPERRNGALIFFVGSDHPVTHAQRSHLCETLMVRERSVDTPIPPGESSIVKVVCGQTSQNDIRRSLAAISPHDIGCLFMTGGDTASLVCRALEMKSLRLVNEFAPGIPLAVAESGPFDAVPVVLKSGGFGDVDLMTRLFTQFARHTEVPAR